MGINHRGLNIPDSIDFCLTTDMALHNMLTFIE